MVEGRWRGVDGGRWMGGRVSGGGWMEEVDGGGG